MTETNEEREEEEIYEKSAASAHIVYEAILKEGEEELERPATALGWSGLAAGLSMGFSLAGEATLRSHLPAGVWRPLIAKLGYSVGFLIVILGRQQLFTENTLTAVLPLLKHKDLRTLSKMLRIWGIVLVTNLIGALLFALAMARTNAFEPEIRAAALDIGTEALRYAFGTVLLRGIYAGWLIALMVWLLPVAETARVWVIIIITYLVGLMSLSHIIAGSVEVMTAAAAGRATWGQCVGGYLFPTLLGNTIGGVSLVAALNHAQVVAGKGDTK